MPAASLRALLTGAIDYAGLFPPASLSLEPRAQELRGVCHWPAESWMLGAFILPFAKFEDASANLAPFDVEHRLCVSALGPPTDNAAEFINELYEGAERTRSGPLTRRNGAIASITQIEMALPAERPARRSPSSTNRALARSLDVPTFWEANVDEEAERTRSALSRNVGPRAPAVFRSSSFEPGA